ncbi:hypothetical protein [Paenibacillus sp. TAF43_2]|uniref:hypothetical protein n=1 Tax=Paenibacillus sp. TAF43_2 TaxID=3233069 RepID=UPI003F943184
MSASRLSPTVSQKRILEATSGEPKAVSKQYHWHSDFSDQKRVGIGGHDTASMNRGSIP